VHCQGLVIGIADSQSGGLAGLPNKLNRGGVWKCNKDANTILKLLLKY